MKFGKRKGQALNELLTAGMFLVLAGVLFGIGAYINSQIQTVGGFTTGTNAYMIISNSTQGILTLANWLQIIAVVIAASVVINVLIHSFMGKREGGL